MRRLLRFILHMCDPAWDALMGTLRLSCVMLLCALCFFWEAEGGGLRLQEWVNIAREMSTAPAGLFLIASLGSVCIEEQAQRRR